MGICSNCISVNKSIQIARRWTCSNVNNKKLDNITGLYFEPLCYYVNGDGNCNYFSTGTNSVTKPYITPQKSIVTGLVTDKFILSCHVVPPETYEIQTYQWYTCTYDDNGITHTDTIVDSGTSKILELSSLVAGTYYYYMTATNTYNENTSTIIGEQIKVIASAS
jgi:hypothetical protein